MSATSGGRPLSGAGRPPLWGGTAGLETLFNADGQQRGGNLRLLLRHLRRRDPSVDPTRDRMAVVLARSLTGAAFNTNPVLAGYVAGPLVALAKRGSEDVLEAAVLRARTTAAPLLAGVGDRLLWGGLRPASALLGFVSALLGAGIPALVYALGYNAVQLYLRQRAWRIGLRGEAAVREELRRGTLDGWIRALGRIARIGLGVGSGALLARPAVSGDIGAAAILAAILGVGYALARTGRVPPMLLAGLGVAASAIAAAVHALLP